MFSWLADHWFTVIIFAAAAVEAYVGYVTHSRIKNLEKIVHPKNDRRIGIQADLSLSNEEVEIMSSSATTASFWYSIYANLTAIFPFLGIMGTVISLMQIGDASRLNENFGVALETTLWGLIFAIAAKVMDSFLAPRLDRALDEADYLVHEHDVERRDEFSRQRRSNGKNHNDKRRDNAPLALESKDNKENKTQPPAAPRSDKPTQPTKQAQPTTPAEKPSDDRNNPKKRGEKKLSPIEQAYKATQEIVAAQNAQNQQAIQSQNQINQNQNRINQGTAPGFIQKTGQNRTPDRERPAPNMGVFEKRENDAPKKKT